MFSRSFFSFIPGTLLLTGTFPCKCYLGGFVSFFPIQVPFPPYIPAQWYCETHLRASFAAWEGSLQISHGGKHFTIQTDP